MGVCELNPSNEYFQEISNPIKMNIDSGDTKEKKSKNNINVYNKDNQKHNINEINKASIYNVYLKNNNDKKKKIDIKTRVINPYKLNNFIINSKTNYSNYKRVPHLKSQNNSLVPKDKNKNMNNLSNNINNKIIINKVNSEENNKLWFKTQYNNFNKIKDIKDFTLNEYNKRNSKKLNINTNSDMMNKKIDLNIFNKNNDKFLKNKSKSNIVYTKALPIDYNNEKKIDNLFILNNNNNYNDNNLLYIIEKKDSIKIDNKNNYSTKKEYKNIIKKYSYNKFFVSNYLLQIKERNWYNELIDISNLLKNKRTENDILITNKYIRKILKLQEHFKWLIESLGIYFNNIIFGENNSYNNNYNYNLPRGNEKIKWFNGFKWKGVYIRVLTNEKNKIIKNENKALNYFYFDYLQLLEQYPLTQVHQLLYDIIFPLIAYTEVNGFILFGSAVMNITECQQQQQKKGFTIYEDISINDIIKNNNDVIKYVNDNERITNLKKDINRNNDYSIYDLENKYYIKDLLSSKLFSELNLYHFIRIKNKFLIFNLSEFIPKLFEIKLNSDLKINYLSVINNKRVYYNSKTKCNLNLKNMSNNLKINCFSNPREILKNIYNIYPSISNLKTKDVVINNIYFRIIYEAQCIKDDNYKNKQFVDYLFNYYNNSGNSIVEPYVILYDLTEPIKLKYSLIKQFNYNNNYKNNIGINSVLNKLYYLNTNYVSFFTAWCEMLNKNTYNIKNYSDLKENMNKYGISSQLKFFSLVNINNPDILDIIKISLLIKAINFIFNKKENDDIISKLSNIKSNNNNNDMNKLSEIRKTKILYIIKSILYPNEIIDQSKKFLINLYEELVFYVNVIFLKLKLIDGYLSLGLLNINKNSNLNMNINTISEKLSGFESPKAFLKHIIKIARNKPFLFITEMEYKLKFIIDPFIKFKSSISIESMNNKLELKHIILNSNSCTYSYINSNELSGLILAKLLYCNNNYINNNNYNYQNNNNVIDDKNNNNKNYNNIEEINYSNKNNLASKPSFMKTNINLNNCRSSIKKENSLHSTALMSDKPNNDNLNMINNGKTSEFVLNDKNKDKSTGENTQRIQSLEKKFSNNLILELPALCYKMSYSYENYKHTEKNKYLNNIYILPDIKIIKTWETQTNKLFFGISSTNGDIEHSIFKTLVYLFIINFFYEKSFTEANKINMKIKDIFKKGNYQLSLADLSIINLFQALIIEKYIESENPYSKSLMLLLMNYGEPRGRNNDSHGILEFIIWKIARKTRLEQKVINDYFKEMYLCLSFYEKKKRFLNLYNTKAIFNYTNNVYNNTNNIKILNEISKNTNNLNTDINNDEYHNVSNESRLSDLLNNNISESPGFDFFGILSKLTNNLDITLNQNVFSDKILDKTIIKYFNFPRISDTTEKLDKIFFTSDFIIYILKEIQSLFISKKIIYNEEYINEYISNEVFNPYPYNYKHQITCNTNESDTNDDYTAEESSLKDNKKLNNYVIGPNKEKNEKYKKNEYFLFPNNTNNIYNYINNKMNQTMKNRKNSNEIISPIKDKKRATMINNGIIREKMKNKNKSVEDIKKKKSNLFSHFLYQEILFKLSYKLNIQSGVVVSFGNNTHNETSYDDYEKVTRPRMIFKLKNIRIEHLYSGWEHNIFLSNNGDIYSFGNNQYYQCGLPNKDNKDKIIKDPTNISVLNNNIKGINASCGNEHSLILSKDNEVYAFGNNEDGVLGLNDNKIKKYEFTKINFGIYTNKIKDIASGTVHNLALTMDNKLFSWGSSQGGQLGLPENYLLSQPGYKTSFFLATPTLIQIFSKNNNKKCDEIIKIGCGEAHSIALNSKGKVYSWGFGSNGQLGLGFCEDSFEPGSGLYKSRRFIPEYINYLEDENIIDIKCGKTFTMFINDKNELYASGVNDLNQLGLNECSPKDHLVNKDVQCYDFVFPTKVDCFLNMKVLKISCGEGHCLAIIKDLISNIQTIWSWGNNKFGQLGQGQNIKKSTPNPINYLSEYNSKKFGEIACGGFHSLCLIKYKENLNWIEDDYNEISRLIDEIGII